MKNLVSFFEIPALDFERAVGFYESLLGIKLETMEGDNEKMAFSPDYQGAISKADDFKPSTDGVLISFLIDNIDKTIEEIKKNQGLIVIEKTAIESDKKGYFAVFLDCEGNKIGLHEKL